MKNTKINKTSNILKRAPEMRYILVACLVLFSVVAVPLAYADRFQEKIDKLSAQNENKSETNLQLGEQAETLSSTIEKLEKQINAKLEVIAKHEASVAELKIEIAKAQKELDTQKELLGTIIRDMYVDGEISPIEMLASSKDLSDFFDKQQYQASVRSKVKTTLDKVTQLKLDLGTRKEKVEKLLAEQEDLRDQLVGQRTEKDRLLSLNASQRNKLDSEIRSNSKKIAELRSQQAAENARNFGGTQVIAGSNGRDTYPNRWRNIPQDAVIDSWGMYNRECVSYTAWKVYESGRHMPYWGGVGNANQWDDNARAAGISVNTTPKRGDVAVAHWGYYGHVMYVESVNSNGTINISQYNWGLDGRYSEAYNLSTNGLVFIHFR